MSNRAGNTLWGKKQGRTYVNKRFEGDARPKRNQREGLPAKPHETSPLRIRSQPEYLLELGGVDLVRGGKKEDIKQSLARKYCEWTNKVFQG